MTISHHCPLCWRGPGVLHALGTTVNGQGCWEQGRDSNSHPASSSWDAWARRELRAVDLRRAHPVPPVPLGLGLFGFGFSLRCSCSSWYLLFLQVFALPSFFFASFPCCTRPTVLILQPQFFLLPPEEQTQRDLLTLPQRNCLHRKESFFPLGDVHPLGENCGSCQASAIPGEIRCITGSSIFGSIQPKKTRARLTLASCYLHVIYFFISSGLSAFLFGLLIVLCAASRHFSAWFYS